MTKGHGELCCRWHSTKEAAATGHREGEADRDREGERERGARRRKVKECCQPLIDPFQRESTLTCLRLSGDSQAGRASLASLASLSHSVNCSFSVAKIFPAR